MGVLYGHEADAKYLEGELEKARSAAMQRPDIEERDLQSLLDEIVVRLLKLGYSPDAAEDWLKEGLFQAWGEAFE